ncbi:MAG: SDR family NAD(P)-dependent oxidoreductase [Chloroflexota bacterium]
MTKIILVTGATDGIGLETSKMLVSAGHHVLVHGRNPVKLDKTRAMLAKLSDETLVTSYEADLSRMVDVEKLADSVLETHPRLDVLINNAGVYSVSQSMTEDGLDMRFAVNTIAPYLLTHKLLKSIGTSGRVINVSSAAQSAVNLDALMGNFALSDGEAYAQSKLALIMWSQQLISSLGENSPTIITVNPGSFLGSKMVKEAYGIDGKDIGIGAKILFDLALANQFGDASGKYFDNDSGRFAQPHRDALNEQKKQNLVDAINTILAGINGLSNPN